MPKDTEQQKLDEALAAVKKLYGKGAIMTLDQSEASEPLDVISTGNRDIDALTGIGGIPRGRVTEIFGPESSGKSTLCLQIIAQTQSNGGRAVYIDAEHALDTIYASDLGVDIRSLFVSQPTCGEEALEIAALMIASGVVSAVIVDSVAALVPKAELEGDFGSPQMGLQARLMSQAMRKLTSMVAQTNTALIFINQVRDKIGTAWGNPETTTGGRALKFFSSLRLDIRRVSAIKKGDEIIGAETKVKSAKNKCSAPYKEVKVPLMYGRGFVNEE